MKILGIIVEYNPFHNGHIYHINKAKEITKSDLCIAVMSGNFVQRGMPAFCDKYIRAEMALKNGVDLVLELPVIYSTSSAQYFAKAAISILDSTKIVNSICFGVEEENINKIYTYANILINEPKNFKNILKNELNKGLSFPKAREIALNIFFNDETNFLLKPNNILALEYIKSLLELNSKIKPYILKRYSSSYNSINIENFISSAKAIRNAVKEKNYTAIKKNIPNNIQNKFFDLINKNLSPINIDNYSTIFQYIIKNINIYDLKNILDIDEGLENRIIKQSNINFDLSKIICNVKSKRYTLTKIQRAIIHILLNINKSDFNLYNKNNFAQYIRVLGFRKDKSFLLKKLKENSKLPVITNLNSIKNLSDISFKMLNKEIQSTDIYYIGCANNNFNKIYKNYEYKKPLVII